MMACADSNTKEAFEEAVMRSFGTKTVPEGWDVLVMGPHSQALPGKTWEFVRQSMVGCPTFEISEIIIPRGKIPCGWR